jgi:sugar phosphate isomerase/epimerase
MEVRMKLSLSTRVAEAPRQKERAVLGLAELIAMATANGYAALCMRASQIGVQTSSRQRDEAAGSIREAGLAVSMVTGNIDIPANNERAGMALRNIGPFLDLAQAFNCDLIRIGMKAHTDIPWARRACDEAAERGVRLAHQCHTCTLFETIDMSLQVAREVGRKNFGIVYEPSNLAVCGQDYGLNALKRLRPQMFNVYLQNMWMRDGGRSTIDTWINGPMPFDLVPFGDARGIDFKAVFDGLRSVGYDGHVTVHHNVADGLDVAQGVREFAGYLRTVADFDAEGPVRAR